MNLDAAINVIADFLHKAVRDTGRCGLEGLAALLLQQATSQEFRLSSAGRQSGRDAATEAGHGNNIKIEIKHYRQTTSLNQRELIAEINEAAESDPDLDIWVLAASRAVSEQIASSLEKQAERLGVDIVILDYGVDGLPRVAVLMAAYSDVTIAWADKCEFQYDSSQIRGALRAIASAPDFEGAKKRVLAKLGSIVGYESARRRTHARLLETLADERDAKSSFRQSLAIRAADAQVIRRAAPIAELDRWWNSPGVPMPALVLGEEGTGKTWATFDWLLGRLGKGDMPLVLPFVVVAENLSGPDPLERLLPRLLTKWTGVPNEEHWARRLDKWLRSEPIGRPLILLVADGLNECPDVHWRSFFASLQAAPWRDKVAILATDRPHHWKKCSMAGVAAIREIPLGGYSDTELDQALASSSISRRDIPHDLLQLISIPRYCRLVIQHYSEMVDSSDFTRERLIYLEISDRYRSRLDYPLTDDRLFEILRNLAEYARANPILKPKDLLSLISVGGGDDRAVYEEIVSGGIVVEISEGLTKILKVDPLRLVFGFGMLLTEELVERFSLDHKEGEVEEFLTSWFEPQPDMDRKVDICGSALFHSLFRQNFPEVAFRGLLRHWLGLRNWADTAQVAFTDYLLRRPNSFIAVADEFWSSERDNAAAQEFLANAFVAHRDNPAVQPFLVPALERWMGFVHPLGRRFWSFDVERNQRLRATLAAHTGLPVLTPEDDVAQEQRVKQAIEARAGRP